MRKEILVFDNIEIEKKNVTVRRLVFFVCRYRKNIGISQDLFWRKNYKYFNGYLYNGTKVKPLNVMLPKISAYVKSYYGQATWRYFLIKDNDLLEKFNPIGQW